MVSTRFKLDRQNILSKLNLNIEAYCKYIAPEGKVQGRNYLLLNTQRDDNNLGSFVVDLATGVWQDFADDKVKGKDLINLTMFLLDCDFYTALKYANTYLNGDIVKSVKPVAVKKEVEQEYTFISCKNSVLPLEHTYFNHKPVKTYIYTDTEGFAQVLLHRYTIEGKKAFLQQSYVAPGAWVLKSMGSNRPLYNLPALLKNKHKPVLIVEGEKAVEALQPLLPEFVITTTLGGSNAPLMSNLNALTGRKVYIWRDNDKAGLDYQDKLTVALTEKVQELHTLDVAKLGSVADGYDGADYVQEHTQAELKKLFETAFKPVVLSVATELKSLLYVKPLITSSTLKNGQYVVGYAKDRDEALKGIKLSVNDYLLNRAIILNVIDTRKNSKLDGTDSMFKHATLPEPNYIIFNAEESYYQYVYLLDNAVYKSDNAKEGPKRLYDRVCYTLTKMAGTFENSAIAECESGMMLNPLKHKFVRNHTKRFNLNELKNLYVVERTNSQENEAYFTNLRQIAYRLVNHTKTVNYVDTFAKELEQHARQLLVSMNIEMSEKEFHSTLNSVICFVKHNKKNFVNKKHILSENVGAVEFQLMHSKERMASGAEYVATRKRHSTSMAVLLSIKNNMTCSATTQQHIADKAGTSSSNISQNYSAMYKVAKQTKLNELEQDMFLNQSASTESEADEDMDYTAECEEREWDTDDDDFIEHDNE